MFLTPNIMEDIRFSNYRLFFFNPRFLVAVAASKQHFLLSPAHIQANTRVNDQIMQGIVCVVP